MKLLFATIMAIVLLTIVGVFAAPVRALELGEILEDTKLIAQSDECFLPFVPHFGHCHVHMDSYGTHFIVTFNGDHEILTVHVMMGDGEYERVWASGITL